MKLTIDSKKDLNYFNSLIPENDDYRVVVWTVLQWTIGVEAKTIMKS